MKNIFVILLFIVSATFNLASEISEATKTTFFMTVEKVEHCKEGETKAFHLEVKKIYKKIIKENTQSFLSMINSFIINELNIPNQKLESQNIAYDIFDFNLLNGIKKNLFRPPIF